MVLDEDYQGFDGLGCKRNQLTVSKEEMLDSIQSKGAEFVPGFCRLRHGQLRNFGIS